MSTEQLEKRLRRRSIHRSRSTAVAITLIVVAVVAAWIGTEAVLQAIGQPPLLADPQTVVDTALTPDAAFTTIAEVIAAALVIAGIILIVLALKPGRQPRSGIDRDRGAVVIDTRILASTAANAAALAAGVPESNTSASARGHRTQVHVVPLSGIPVDRTTVEHAVQDRLSRLGGKHGSAVQVTVEQKGNPGMTTTNRGFNRVLLFLIGLISIITGVTIGAGVLQPVRDALQQVITLPEQVSVPDQALWIIAGVCAVIIVLALIIVFTRGGGGTSVAVRERSGEDQVTVNVALVRDVIDHELAGVHDIVGSKVDTYLVKKTRAARIRVHVRRGGDAVTVLDAVDHALATLDRTLGRQIPVLVHLSGGTRTALAHTTRVQ